MHSTSNIGDEADRFGHADRELSASSRSAAGRAVIQFPFQKPSVAAASMALEDAMEPDDCFESLGSIAVRLVADWSLPRISCWRQGEEEPAASALKSPAWEG